MESISHEHFKSVVKIFVVKCAPNYTNPWQMSHQIKSNYSGFMISDRQIICTAHAVVFAKSIRVRKHSDGSGKKYAARVAHIGHVCDLALLEIEDEINTSNTAARFWEDTRPLQLSHILPNLQATVFALGYPAGGETICVTKGVVSRVGLTTYHHSLRSLPSIQFDAAINEGSSGGPVMQRDRVVGIAFQAMEDKQNIGFCIPAVVINHFLQDCHVYKRVPSFPKLGFSFINLENPSHKKELGLNEDQTGVFIRSLTPLTDASKKLQVGDVLLEYDGIIIADDGTIPNLLRSKEDDIGERLEFSVLGALKYKNEKCNLKIWRDQKVQLIDVEVYTTSTLLVPLHLYYLSDNEMREHMQRYQENEQRARAVKAIKNDTNVTNVDVNANSANTNTTTNTNTNTDANAIIPSASDINTNNSLSVTASLVAENSIPMVTSISNNSEASISVEPSTLTTKDTEVPSEATNKNESIITTNTTNTTTVTVNNNTTTTTTTATLPLSTSAPVPESASTKNTSERKNSKLASTILSEATTSPAVGAVLSVISVDSDVITDISLNENQNQTKTTQAQIQNTSNSQNENKDNLENKNEEKQPVLEIVPEEKKTDNTFNLTKLIRKSLRVTNTPSYLLYGGVVFIPLSRPYLRNYYGQQWSTKCPLQLAILADESKEDVNDQIIIVSHVLSHAVNIGYESYYMRQLLKVNGKTIHNMVELMLLLEESDLQKDTFIRFDLWQTIVMVLECDKARASLPDILRMHNIPADRSEDLKFLNDNIKSEDKDNIFTAMKIREEKEKEKEKEKEQEQAKAKEKAKEKIKLSKSIQV